MSIPRRDLSLVSALIMCGLMSEVSNAAPSAYARNEIAQETRINNKAPTASEGRFALLIGNNTYRDLPSLGSAIRDAEVVAEALRGAGFETIVVSNANRNEMLQAITAFTLSLKSGGIGFFYYAGHGIQLGEEQYLLPVDVPARIGANDLDSRAIVVSTDLVNRIDGDTNSPLTMVLLDACRDSTLRIGGVSRAASPVALNGGNLWASADRVILGYPTSMGARTPDGVNEVGTYAAAVAAEILNPNNDLFTFQSAVIERVEQASAETQRPSFDVPDPRLLAFPFAFHGGSIRVQSEVSGPLFIDGVPGPVLDRGQVVELSRITPGRHTLTVRSIVKDVWVSGGATTEVVIGRTPADQAVQPHGFWERTPSALPPAVSVPYGQMESVVFVGGAQSNTETSQASYIGGVQNTFGVRRQGALTVSAGFIGGDLGSGSHYFIGGLAVAGRRNLIESPMVYLGVSTLASVQPDRSTIYKSPTFLWAGGVVADVGGPIFRVDAQLIPAVLDLPLNTIYGRHGPYYLKSLLVLNDIGVRVVLRDGRTIVRVGKSGPIAPALSVRLTPRPGHRPAVYAYSEGGALVGSRDNDPTTFRPRSATAGVGLLY